jgi:two-component system, cell cycle response regulator
MHKVLIVDDSTTVHAMLDERLRAEGVELHHALSGVEGLRKARQLEPDLILLDVELPALGGMEVCRLLKADIATRDIAVIFLTSAADSDSKVRGFDLGAIDYVTKPFDQAELCARVRAALRTRTLMELLATRAKVDGLTGLYNRAYFDQRIGEEVAAARRYGRAVSLVIADVDHFKLLNDRYGHPFGDRVLERIGALIRRVRDTDAACRYGGEEFALILTETTLDGAMVVAESMRLAIGMIELEARGESVGVTASFGVATTGAMATLDTSVLIDGADRALYRAKQLGRNRVSSSASLSTLPPNPRAVRDTLRLLS